jgi:hypothetical protein
MSSSTALRTIVAAGSLGGRRGVVGTVGDCDGGCDAGILTSLGLGPGR